MIEGIIRSLLGPSLTPVLDYLQNNPGIVAIFLFVLVAIYIAGRIQLGNIYAKTKEFVITRYKEEIQRRPNITPTGFFKVIYPEWEKQVKKWGWFIPHKLDLWPVPVNPETVKNKMTFDAKWVAEILKQNKIETTPDQDRD